ncbi:MAG: peptidase U32 family protein [Silvanigrellaceae bacterium]
MSNTDSRPLSNRRIPEILAPVGGREQFFAALNSGADAVFLGLKNFNARARAENFTLEDLRELVPLAHQHEMKVLVTMNILIKNGELPALVETLSGLEEVGVDAIIVQDLGLAKICRTYFPALRMHASTQLAVHNLDGVRKAIELGFKRVVLARELTAIEIKRIREAIPQEDVELEAFCHGSLCYSYSGLCFFSGAEDARSGNRGECAYTCRKPYKILNEPGHGFLFSMKDLNTIEHLELLVDAGVDTLKIEGRKKDAQYVSTVVQSYRKRLDEIFEGSTLRKSAPMAALLLAEENLRGDRDLQQDLSLGFARGGTSFFLKGRYHENVIDLDNPTHKGQSAGVVSAVRGRNFTITTLCSLQRFDGLRIDPAEKLYHSTPQHGQESAKTISGVKAKYDNNVCQFSLRNMTVGGRQAAQAQKGEVVEIELPLDANLPMVGDLVFRTRSDALRSQTEKLSRPLGDVRLRPLHRVNFRFEFSATSESVEFKVTTLKFGKSIYVNTKAFAAIRPRSGSSNLSKDLKELFSTLGNCGFAADNFDFIGDDQWFIPRSQLKEMKRELESALPEAYSAFLRERKSAALEATIANPSLPSFSQKQSSLRGSSPSKLAIKADRLEYLDWIQDFLSHNLNKSSTDLSFVELVFELKRAFLPDLSFAAVIDRLQKFSSETGASLRLALPTVLRAWDEPLIKRWTQEFVAAGIGNIEVGNISHFTMLERWGLASSVSSYSSDFTLYSLNVAAASQLLDVGVERICLSIEDDSKNISSLLSDFPPQVQPQVILYKDTPLFIAESCSLTALHNGCPTSKVCGYRTLEIQNDDGETFYVAHESCKSIVYAKQPFAVAQHRRLLEAEGVSFFRADFLTRPYTRENLFKVLESIFKNAPVADTHSANFNRTLL